jgi:hypothetical protein
MLRYIVTREAGRERKLLLRFVCDGGHLKTGDGRCDGWASQGGPGEPPGTETFRRAGNKALPEKTGARKRDSKADDKAPKADRR